MSNYTYLLIWVVFLIFVGIMVIMRDEPRYCWLLILPAMMECSTTYRKGTK